MVNIITKSVLIVDDNTENINVLAKILEKEGFDIRAAKSGNEAIASVKAKPPGVILMDIKMPGISGYEACRRIKSIKEFHSIPIIFISALTETIDKVKAFKEGGQDYISKPFQPEEVLARVGVHFDLFEQQKKLENINIDQYFQLQSLFKYAAVAIWEEDFSEVKKRLDLLTSEGIKDIEKHLNQNPEEIKHLASLIKIRDVNQKALEIHGVNSKKELINYISERFTKESFKVFRDEIISLFKGANRFESEIPIKQPGKDLKHMHLNLSLLPDIEKPWDRVFISFIDISKRKQAESEIAKLKRQIEEENIYLKEEIKLEYNFSNIVGNSEPLKEMLKQVELVSRTDSTVLITGETGSGKELVARAIHDLSSRKNKTFIKINCSTLPSELIESELFGHEKGAFTSAISRKTGRFELADKGTIFLDEIGDFPVNLQPKLLRVLQEGEFERVGGENTLKVDVRVISATNRNLKEQIQEGNFRSDLYFRLKVFPIISPPLRERKPDIPELVNHFIKKYSLKTGKKIKIIPKKVLNILEGYSWPGNIRELEHVIERAMILSPGDKLEIGDWFDQNQGETSGSIILSLDDYQKNYIIKILERTNWKIRGPNGAAKLLKLNPTTLEARIKKLDIKR